MAFGIDPTTLDSPEEQSSAMDRLNPFASSTNKFIASAPMINLPQSTTGFGRKGCRGLC